MGNCVMSQYEGVIKTLIQVLGFGWVILGRVEGSIGLFWIGVMKKWGKFYCPSQYILFIWRAV